MPAGNIGDRSSGREATWTMMTCTSDAGACPYVQVILRTEAVKGRLHAYNPSQFDTAWQDSLQLLNAALGMPIVMRTDTTAEAQRSTGLQCRSLCEVQIWLQPALQIIFAKTVPRADLVLYKTSYEVTA